jgi:sialate O-acetylesterase
MAVITDYGSVTEIHPVQKEPVAARLACAAEGLAYGWNVIYKGPIFKSMTVTGGRALITFNNADGGLMVKGVTATGFTIAGADKKFYNAKAEVGGNQVMVSSPNVPNPVAVRFGWADYPVVNLYNKSGLPASPFRTDGELSAVSR